MKTVHVRKLLAKKAKRREEENDAETPCGWLTGRRIIPVSPNLYGFYSHGQSHTRFYPPAAPGFTARRMGCRGCNGLPDIGPTHPDAAEEQDRRG
jgi:hypothetical protein